MYHKIQIDASTTSDQSPTRLPWFPCYPSAMLGALSAMHPEEGYVYVVVLFRIYETDGPIADDEMMLSRRTGLPRKRVAAAIERLCGTGKLVKTHDGRLHSPVAASEIEQRRLVAERRSEAGKANIEKRWQKAKQNQRMDLTTGNQPYEPGNTSQLQIDTHEHLHLQTHPSPSEREAPPAPKSYRRKVKTQLDQRWQPSESDRTYAAQQGFSVSQIESEVERFIQHYRSHGDERVDWSATWKNWVSNDIAKAKLAASGRKDDSKPPTTSSVVHVMPDDTEAWNAWLTHYKTKGMTIMIEHMRSLLTNQEALTVSSRFPASYRSPNATTTAAA